MVHSAPRYAPNAGVAAALENALGASALCIEEKHGELSVHIAPASLTAVMTTLRDDLAYQQLMDIAGVDWLGEVPRYEVVYCLLSVTKNHRLRIHLRTEEEDAVPSVTGIWPNAGWLEREVFDMYGVVFAGNTDLRRILTDYGFEGHPQRKDFPLSGFVELRWSEEDKRVKYEPVQLAQDFRTFDFESPWEGATYTLPGDEKAIQSGHPPRGTPPQVNDPKVTEKTSDTGAGAAANVEAKKRTVRKKPVKMEADK